jgi:hypothetical protein
MDKCQWCGKEFSAKHDPLVVHRFCEVETLRSLADDLIKWYEDDFMVNEGDETINGFYDRARELRGKV